MTKKERELEEKKLRLLFPERYKKPPKRRKNAKKRHFKKRGIVQLDYDKFMEVVNIYLAGGTSMTKCGEMLGCTAQTFSARIRMLAEGKQIPKKFFTEESIKGKEYFKDQEKGEE